MATSKLVPFEARPGVPLTLNLPEGARLERVRWSGATVRLYQLAHGEEALILQADNENPVGMQSPFTPPELTCKQPLVLTFAALPGTAAPSLISGHLKVSV